MLTECFSLQESSSVGWDGQRGESCMWWVGWSWATSMQTKVIIQPPV